MTDGPFDNVDRDPPIEVAPDARADYDKPADVLADETLSEDEKREILTQWAGEIDDRLKAEEEGMSASDPIHERAEAALAKEAEKVSRALLELEGSE